MERDKVIHHIIVGIWSIPMSNSSEGEKEKEKKSQLSVPVTPS